MIIRFMLTDSALSLEGKTHDERLLITRSTIDVWRRHGRLVSILDGDINHVIKSINKMPQQQKKLWKSALKHLRPTFDTEILDKESASELLSLKIGPCPFDLNLIGATSSEIMEAGAAGEHECELARVDYLDQADILQKLSSHIPLYRDRDTEEIISKHLIPLFSHARSIRIIDRYSLISIVRTIKGELRLGSRYEKSGLIKVIRCALNCSNAKVEIKASMNEYSRVPHMHGIFVDLVETALNNALSDIPGYLERLAIRYYDDAIFMEHGHERIIAVDSHVLEIGRGLQALDGEKVQFETEAVLRPMETFHTRKFNRFRETTSLIAESRFGVRET